MLTKWNVLHGAIVVVLILSLAPSSCHKSQKQVSIDSSFTDDLASRLKSKVYQQVPESRFTDNAKVALNSYIENGARYLKEHDGMDGGHVTEAENNASRLGAFLEERSRSTGLEGRGGTLDVGDLQVAKQRLCPLYPFC
jgi:hypothetical protein